MQPLRTLNLGNQPIWLFDLGLSNTARSQRRAVLDTLLAEFFRENLTTIATDFSQFIDIIHSRGQPAQAVFLAKNGEKMTVNLAISYALPYVAVAVSVQKIGLDLCAIRDFDTMTRQEKHQFCHDYFTHLPVTVESDRLAQYWSQLEAYIKYWQIPLSEGLQNPENFPNLLLKSEKIYVDKQALWLSVAMYK